MQGRTDKGLLLTTGTFTSDARKEATRDGVPPIELVDGDKLVVMFERVELGLKTVERSRSAAAVALRINVVTPASTGTAA